MVSMEIFHGATGKSHGDVIDVFQEYDGKMRMEQKAVQASCNGKVALDVHQILGNGSTYTQMKIKKWGFSTRFFHSHTHFLWPLKRSGNCDLN